MTGSTARFSMAPMAGITDAAFRARLRRNGCSLLFTEMVSAAALARKNRRTLAYLRDPDVGQDLAVQIFGAVPEELAEAALLAQEAGFEHIDLNMGCPVRKVVRSGAGAALMAEPERARRCLEALRRAVRGTFSIKLRSGWDSSQVNCLQVGEMAAECGVDAITLHPRTRAQGYSGTAVWSLVKVLADRLPVPVVGNGDVVDAVGAVTRLRQASCHGVMIGRGAVRRPWIFRQVAALEAGRVLPEPDLPWIGEDLLRQFDDLVSLKGEAVGVMEMRKFLAWSAKGFPGAGDFRRRVQEIKEAQAMVSEVRRFFGRERAEDRPGEWRTDRARIAHCA